MFFLPELLFSVSGHKVENTIRPKSLQRDSESEREKQLLSSQAA